ncbi:MAG: diguanylate cyclase [Halioglobus sp.]|jgi:diguanylate cyclase (GGDEF)-like protein|nr:diguanylate cyclase [Halioglobus sp.]
MNINTLKSKVSWLNGLIRADRRSPPIGSNHELANEMTRVLVTVGAVAAIALSIAGLLTPGPVSRISIGFALFIAVCLLLWSWQWQRVSISLNRGFVLVALIVVQARFLAGWLFSPAADAPGAILTGLVYVPLILFMVALFEGSRRGVLIGMVSAVVMGVSLVIGSQRPEMQEIHFNDWRLGIVVSISIGTYTFCLARWSDQQRALEDSALQLSLLEREANTDPLTRLLNRRGLDVIISSWIISRQKFGVLLLDLDHFKQVNDRYGHDVGDKVLRTVSDTIRATARDDDVLVRWGGEELMVITRSAEKSALTGFAERMRQAISNISDPDLPSITVSIGISRSGTDEDFEDVIVVRADKALYQAKQDGRDTVHALWTT